MPFTVTDSSPHSTAHCQVFDMQVKNVCDVANLLCLSLSLTLCRTRWKSFCFPGLQHRLPPGRSQRERFIYFTSQDDCAKVFDKQTHSVARNDGALRPQPFKLKVLFFPAGHFLILVLSSPRPPRYTHAKQHKNRRGTKCQEHALRITFRKF